MTSLDWFWFGAGASGVAVASLIVFRIIRTYNDNEVKTIGFIRSQIKTHVDELDDSDLLKRVNERNSSDPEGPNSKPK